MTAEVLTAGECRQLNIMPSPAMIVRELRELEHEKILDEAYLEHARREEPGKPLRGLGQLLRQAIEEPEEPFEMEGFTLSIVYNAPGTTTATLRRRHDGACWSGTGGRWPLRGFETLEPLQ